MKRKLFDKALDFEINVIGYKNEGESIVFFLKADGKAVYAGLVDCYEDAEENVALTLLKNEKMDSFDFVCWTHPHADHTIGMDRIISEFCDNKTLFWIPPFISKDVEACPSAAQSAYKEIFEALESKKRIKMRIREASDAKILERFECCGNISIHPYIFEIRSFAPDTTLLGELKVQERFNTGNVYSIGLVINIGHFYVVLAGDVENRTIKCIPDFNFNIKERIDYIKIPHHASQGSSYLIDRFNELGIASPALATTTVLRLHNLPDKEVLKRYAAWGKDIAVYATGDIENCENDIEKSGIVRTSFDVLERNEVPIKTMIFGNAVCVSSFVSL